MASPNPVVDLFYYHQLIAQNVDNYPTKPLPDPPSLIQGHVNLTLPAMKARNSNPDAGCSNSRCRRGLWLTNPIPKIPKAYEKVGFLTQLGLLCSAAKVRECNNKACREIFALMDEAVPRCSWDPFRHWALAAMSCQTGLITSCQESLEEKTPEGLARADRIGRAHTHLANVVHACYVILENARATHQSLLWPTHDGFPGPATDLRSVCNVIYWMISIQTFQDLGKASLGRWDQYYLPRSSTVPAIRDAARNIANLHLCNSRFWNLVNLAERKQSDLPDIVDRLSREPRRTALQHLDHHSCAPTKCQYSHKDSTKVGQLHKCEDGDCKQSEYPVEVLLTALELGEGTAWSTVEHELSAPDVPYIAISHVWADGTGVGVAKQGRVNSCLFGYFASIAKKLGCKGIWWDALSIPLEPKARGKALSRMHKNYANAEYTVVHDRYLLNIQYADPETACLAIVLSPWFTRGWTALELRMATRVKVLFKGPNPHTPDIKDLDDDLLAKQPGTVSRVHWLASTVIRRLRTSAIEYIDDILAILRPRDTSWVRDRTVIAGLLTGVPRCDYSRSEGEITREIILYLGFVPYSSLLHGRATMFDTGPFSWCPATLDEMPIGSNADLGNHDARRARLLRVQGDGAVVGKWYCELVTARQIRNNKIEPHGDHVSVAVPFYNALLDWENCLILRERKGDSGPAVLAVTLNMSEEQGRVLVDCRYIGAARVAEDDEQDEKKSDEEADEKQDNHLSCDMEVRMGWQNESPECRARDVISKWLKIHRSLDRQVLPSVSQQKNSRKSDEKKPAQGSADRDKKNFLQRLTKRAGKSQTAPWYTSSGIGYYSSSQEDETEESDPESNEEESRRVSKQLLAQAFQSPNAGHLAHLFVRQRVDIPDDVIVKLSVRELSLLSSAYLLNGLRDEARATCDRAARMAPDVVTPGDISTLDAMAVLGKACWKTESFDDAKRIYRILIDSCVPGRAQERRLQLQALGELSLLYAQLRQMSEASACYQRALDGLGMTVPDAVYSFTYDAVTRLSWPYWQRDDRDREAEAVYKTSLGVFERELSNRDAITLITAYNLAATFLGQGGVSEAEEMLKDIINGLEEVAGVSHELTLRAKLDQARIHILQRRINRPERLADLVQEFEACLGQQYWLTRLASLTVGVVHRSVEQFMEAIPFLEHAQETPTTHDTVDLYIAACARRELGMVHAMQGNLAEAETNYQGAQEQLCRLSLSEHLEMYVMVFCLATIKDKRGDLDVADQMFQDSLTGMERVCGPTDPETREVVRELGHLCRVRIQDEVIGENDSKEHILRAIHRLSELLRSCGDLTGSNARIERALPGYEDVFGTGNISTELEVDRTDDPVDLQLEDDEIVVKNAAVAISQFNYDSLDAGWEDDSETPLLVADDVAGTVVRVGSNESRFKVGDSVLGLAIYSATEDLRHAGFQDHTIIPSKLAAHIPRTVSFRQAVVLPLGVSTAAAALFQKEHLRLPPPTLNSRQSANRKLLLVWGGTTSAGCNAIQLAVAAGCDVVATDLPKNFDYVRELGASHVVNSCNPTASAGLRNIFRGKKSAGAFDTVGSEESIRICGSVVGQGHVVSASKVSAADIRLNEVSSWIFEEFLPRALAEGKYKTAPDPLPPLGLGLLQIALEAHKKLVVTVQA